MGTATLKRAWKVLRIIVLVTLWAPILFSVALVGWTYSKDKTNGTVDTSGVARPFLLYIPKSHDVGKPTPLLISLHGAAGWAALQRDISGWNRLADEHGFIVAYPSGARMFSFLSRGPRVWRVDDGPGVDLDARYISDLIDKLEHDYNIDRQRVYVDGLSNGGGMAFVVACRLADRVAAVGEVAAAETLPYEWCHETRPVAVIKFHGTADPIVAYAGGKSPDRFNPVMFPAVRDWVSSWARRNRCGDPVDEKVTAQTDRLTYTNCADNADVVLYTVNGGGHAWPGGMALPEWWVGKTTNDINATELMWEFFAQHRRGDPVRSVRGPDPQKSQPSGQR